MTILVGRDILSWVRYSERDSSDVTASAMPWLGATQHNTMHTAADAFVTHKMPTIHRIHCTVASLSGPASSWRHVTSHQAAWWRGSSGGTAPFHADDRGMLRCSWSRTGLDRYGSVCSTPPHEKEMHCRSTHGRTGLLSPFSSIKQLHVGAACWLCAGLFPSALPGSAAILGCFSHRPDAPTCHARRGHPANLAAESVASARPDRCQKAAARGHGALARLRALSRGLCLARPLCSGASHTSQMR